MGIIDERKAIIQPIRKAWYQGKVASIDMLRLDLLHPVISGNKWYKLRLNLAYAVDHGFKTIVTFGGAFSNHLVATACAAKQFGLASVGIVRGHQDHLTPTLQQCRDYGMELLFVTREDYRNRHQPLWAENLAAHFDEILIIPEGGANERGRKGAELITRFISQDYTHIATAVGTGTTIAGLRQKLPAHQHMLGFVPIKDTTEQQHYIIEHISEDKRDSFTLIPDNHFGGFGKWNDTLISFMNDFYRNTTIPLDIVYTSKMMYNLRELLDQNYFSAHERILCIHSGGLQGNASVGERFRW